MESLQSCSIKGNFVNRYYYHKLTLRLAIYIIAYIIRVTKICILQCTKVCRILTVKTVPRRALL